MAAIAPCAYCGKAAKRATTVETVRLAPAEPFMPYQGNYILIRETVEFWTHRPDWNGPGLGAFGEWKAAPDKHANLGDKRWVKRILWDGVSYLGRYGGDRFCTLRCAEAFAEAAHKAGYRVTR